MPSTNGGTSITCRNMAGSTHKRLESNACSAQRNSRASWLIPPCTVHHTLQQASAGPLNGPSAGQQLRPALSLVVIICWAQRLPSLLPPCLEHLPAIGSADPGSEATSPGASPVKDTQLLAFNLFASAAALTFCNQPL